MARARPRRGGRIYRPRERVGGVLQAGFDGIGRSPAVSIFTQRQLLREAMRTWPDAVAYRVAVFARFPVWDMSEDSGSRRGIKANYARDLPPFGENRYQQWRAANIDPNLAALRPSIVARAVVAEYDGRGPIKMVTVTPVW